MLKTFDWVVVPSLSSPLPPGGERGKENRQKETMDTTKWINFFLFICFFFSIFSPFPSIEVFPMLLIGIADSLETKERHKLPKEKKRKMLQSSGWWCIGSLRSPFIFYSILFCSSFLSFFLSQLLFFFFFFG